MHCPACRSDLRHTNVAEHQIFACPSCHGYFVTEAQLREIERKEKLSLSAKGYDPSSAGTTERPRACPRCDARMQKAKYGQFFSLVVDRCRECSGVWLDAGKLEAIKSAFDKYAANLHRNKQFRQPVRQQTDTFECPKCGFEQERSLKCKRCGIIFEKYLATKNAQTTVIGSEGVALENPDVTPRQRKPWENSKAPTLNSAGKLSYRVSAQSRTPSAYLPTTKFFQIILLFSLVLAGVSYVQKDKLPTASFYQQSLLKDPVQTSTNKEQFSTEVDGNVYTITPQFEYELNGVVVSYHTSSSWWDIYHRTLWKDFLNIKDLCVIWGDNVKSEIYRQMKFSNSTWTCWIYALNDEVYRRFASHQLSNNHLLVGNPDTRKAILEAEHGDQIYFRGVLASYAHINNQFQRGTSTSRTDTGDGACETVFVEDFRIVRKANVGSRRLYEWGKFGVILAVIGLVINLFAAPVRIRR